MPQLVVYAAEWPLRASRLPENAGRVAADFQDERLAGLARGSPADSLKLFSFNSVIENAHLAPGLLEAAPGFLESRPQDELRVCGAFSPETLRAVADDCRGRGVVFRVRELRLPRAVCPTLSGCLPRPESVASLEWIGGESPLERAGMAAGNAGPSSLWWQEQVSALTLFFAARLRKLHSTARFHVFLQCLAANTAGIVSWSELGRKAGVSPPTARAWGLALEACGVIRLVPAMPCPPPRRAKLRPRLCWNAPGMALWLLDPRGEATPPVRAAALENCVMLALADAFPSCRIRHFLDTNGVAAPLILDGGGEAPLAVFFLHDAPDAERAARSLRSLGRARLASSRALAVRTRPGLPAPEGDFTVLDLPLPARGR